MNSFRKKSGIIALILIVCFVTETMAYPIDGYVVTGIKRLLNLEWILSGEIPGTKPIPGAQKSIKDIKLNLAGEKGSKLDGLPEVDPELQKALDRLFPNLNESYSVALLDITPGKEIRYASRKADRGFQPGSVGKLAVITAFFCELENVYPDSFEKRQQLLKTKIVRAGSWALYDEHTVPFFNPETKKLVKRTVQAKDTFSLYEWADNMMSVSNNGAATVVWREAILMRIFGEDYPSITEEQAEEYFKITPKAELAEISRSVVNEPLRNLGITEDEWRLGSMFTKGGTAIVPAKGGSIGSPNGMMKFLIALEKGEVIDQPSSLEIKRLMYMTDRRIRYAAAKDLTNAAVYFKSGSLYSCDRSKGEGCAKYMGNASNYMNSVAIVEHPDSVNKTYMVTLMTNVLRKNSAYDHLVLASRIDKLLE